MWSFALALPLAYEAPDNLLVMGHILVDGKKIDIASFVCRTGQKISLAEKARDNQIVLMAEKITSHGCA